MREDQLVRHWHILRTLEKRRQGVTVMELSEELGCHERTVYRDLDALTAAGFPIYSKKADNETRYRFTDGYKPGASLEVANDELLALYLSRGLLKMMEGTLFQKSLDRLIAKVLEKIPEENLEYFKTLAESVAVGKEAARDYGSKQGVIKAVMEGLSSMQTLRISYKSANTGKQTDRLVDPYKLWYANEAFYLIGWCHVHDMVRTFLVDRIESAIVTDKGFTEKDGFDFSDYVGQSFRVISDGKKEHVRVLFQPEVAHCFEEKKWHPSQRCETLDDGSVLVTIEAEGLDEIRSWVLSWGALAEVLEPKALRDEISRTAAHLADVYEKDNGER